MPGIKALMDRLEELKDVPSRAAKATALRINTFIAKQFLDGTDPYGTPWRRLAPYTIAKKGHDTKLVLTGDLARKTRAYPMQGSGIEIRSTEIGQIHQDGTSDGRPPRRAVLPDRAELPDEWLEAIDEETEKAFKARRK